MRPGAALRDLATYARFAAGLPAFTGTRITLDDARTEVRRRLERRSEYFLTLVERAVYANPNSPYLPLLRDAGCQAGDLRAMVEDRGIEATLEALRQEGVYVTLDEFRGRVPIRRGSRTIPVRDSAFDNPFLSRQLESRTGGSTGAPGRIPHDLDSLAAQCHTKILAYHAHGVLDSPLGLWRDGLPSVVGLKNVLQSVVMGNPVRRWFVPVVDEDRPALRFRLANRFVVRACRVLGQPVPRPEPVGLARAQVVAKWAADAAGTSGSCLVRTSPSMALRIGTAAADHGIDLAGVTIMGGGEPVTLGKVEPVTRAGARFVSTYAFTEVGWAGVGCADAADPTDVHLLEDGLALITHRQPAAGGPEVDTLFFTTLLPSAHQVLINLEMDDHGVVERRACGCPLDQAGFRTHLRGIRSARKLTGEGVTLLGTDMVRILEEVLPARFGGTAHDYQLHEREDADGLTRLVLVVDPSVALPGEREAIETVLDALSADNAMANYAAGFWRSAGSLRIERRKPEWGGNQKFPPLVVGR